MLRFFRTSTKLLTGIVIAGALFSAAAQPAAAQSAIPDADPAVPEGNETLVIGGGLPFGLYFPLAGSLCRLIETSPDGGNCAVASLPDSSAAISAIQSRRVPFALVQSDWLHHAVRGTSRYQEVGPAQELRSVLSFYAESFTVLVRSEGAVQTLGDLDEKRVSVGPIGSYRTIVGDAALEAVGLDRDDLAEESTEPVVNALDRLCEGQLDAIFAMAVHPAELISDAARRCGVMALSLSDDTLSKLRDALQGYSEVVIPAQTYAGQEAPVRTIGLRTVLVTTASASPTLVAQTTATIAQGLDRLNAAHPAFRPIAPDDLAVGAQFAPLHPSAAQVLGVSSQ